MTNFTASQKAVIAQQHNNLLVSASAGSGKTTVLIERIMRKLAAGTAIDQLLVVTFTNLAAKHMKQKLEDQLNTKISELLKQETDQASSSPAVQRLRQQLNLLGVANISTLDAFCLRLIQRYYYVIDLDPVFRLLTDNTEGLLIRDQVWGEVREQLYGEAGQQFARLTANFSNDRSDDGLSALIMRLFDFAQSTPDPEAWLQALPATYVIETSTVTASKFYQTQLLPLLVQTCQTMQTNLAQALQAAQAGELEDKTIKAITDAQQALTKFTAQLTTASWNECREACATFKFGRMKKIYKDDPLRTSAAAKVGQLVQTVKDQFKQLNENYFAADEKEVLTIMAGSAKLVTALVRATLSFKTAFAAEKRRRHVLDFSDLEHLTLQILTSQNDSGRGALSQLRAQFDEVMVDEYQDINSLQETILQLLARQDPGNMFMVGDVKQSIYQFRLADPLLFLHKYQDYGEHPDHGDRIVLAENFRSVANVDHLANLIFSQLMDAPVGQIDYDEAAKLKYGPQDYPPDLAQTTSLLLYQAGVTPDETEADPDNFSIDDLSAGSITMVAQKILALKAMDKPIYDRKNKVYRPFRYSDAALLVPTRNHNLTIIDIFKRLQIPIVVNDAQNYFQTTEIRIMMSLLSIIDNPYQDIPLVAVLRSPIVGLDENQLVYLRIQNKTSDYFQALKDFYAAYPTRPHDAYGDQIYASIERFMTQLTEFRDLARRNQLVTLIWRIYERTGFLDYVGGMPAGKQRQANLNALYERAHAYETGSFKGLFQFVRFIKRMQEKDQDLAEAVSETETEAVSVMTIHGSKGLEYPVVFIMDLDKQFNQTDTRQSALLDREAGIGITYLDPKTRVKYPTLPRLMTQQVVSRKLRAEEMRKLYVAVTRAEQQLYLVGTIESIESATEKWRRVLNDEHLVLDDQARITAKSDLDWLGMTLIRHPDFKDYWDGETPAFSLADDKTKLTLELGDPESVGQTAIQPQMAPEKQPSAVELVEAEIDLDVDQATQAEIQKIMNFHYPAQVATETTAYQSVSEVKRLFEDPDTPLMQANPTISVQQSRPSSRYVTDYLATPQFLQTAQTPTGAEVGSATHLVLEQLPLDAPVTTAVVETTIAELVMKQVLTAPVAKLIDVTSVVGFYASELGQQILATPSRVRREVPFSLLMPAWRLFDDFKLDDPNKILIHGIIDGYLDTPTGLILFDYKTDHVKQPEALLERYAGQVNLYAAALASMYAPKPVISQYLYSLTQQALIPVPTTKK
ncbi:helicase-exonuclease AddAB subunit AddA [Lactiplantibacillus sp. WILCCON 0030]|uniref:ATP-dependent helicase/nuclease subunit A n=1 Tax=Lactiplantibacillus brownii TaxID=3069269 RepID=A0ABU1AAX9_9LACO|nr:helicase-exonuclease AddAB subunit AddA [Lactiplantibacillus brownii]MDQ7938026.1 helicase-exonuclease AddAB subunit AddA [Lactiplantibacillus brownii]